VSEQLNRSCVLAIYLDRRHSLGVWFRLPPSRRRPNRRFAVRRSSVSRRRSKVNVPRRAGKGIPRPSAERLINNTESWLITRKKHEGNAIQSSPYPRRGWAGEPGLITSNFVTLTLTISLSCAPNTPVRRPPNFVVGTYGEDCTRNFPTPANTTAIAYRCGQKIDQSLRVFVACNSGRFYKRQKIASRGSADPGRPEKNINVR